ncbi:hypothetical protein [Rivularia sp. UHCC 0363]|uniref:hypothetical protein n=1 Tax=Rivularia sp. UHCC 0363 TaxID=3110244 RepID=UPI002B2042C5|nr:hypothetical protein [Rivularia sp. UHCC 0363]MEA5595745.1 hypothetical protein [Rivularia sp. UHCC 0363]
MGATSYLLSTLLIASVPQTGMESALKYRNYPSSKTSGQTFVCYAQTSTPKTFDLSRLCGFKPSPSVSETGGSGGTVTGSGSGRCDTPNQTASDGSLCGGRAASERKGGR